MSDLDECVLSILVATAVATLTLIEFEILWLYAKDHRHGLLLPDHLSKPQKKASGRLNEPFRVANLHTHLSADVTLLCGSTSMY